MGITKKEAFEKVSKLLKEFLNIKNEKFENAKLSDGTLIQWEGELKEGTPIMMVDTDGNMTPISDDKSPIQMEDGTIITCVGGLVTKIEKKNDQPDEDEFAELLEQLGVVLKKQEETLKTQAEKLAALEQSQTAQTAAFEEIKKTVTDSGTDVKAKFDEIVKIVAEIAAEPAADDDDPPKGANKFKKTGKEEPKETPSERLHNLLHKKENS